LLIGYIIFDLFLGGRLRITEHISVTFFEVYSSRVDQNKST